MRNDVTTRFAYYDALPADLRQFLQNADRNYCSYKIWKFLTNSLQQRMIAIKEHPAEVRAALQPYLYKKR